MKKWLFALLPTLLAAQGTFDPLGTAGRWELGGAAIYWRGCTPEFDVGTVYSDQRYFSVGPGWELGWRIFGSYYTESCCNFFTVDWIHLKTTDAFVLKPESDSVTRLFFTNLATPSTGIVRVGGKVRTKYNRINMRGGRYLHRGCDVGFYVYGGGRYIGLDKKLWTFNTTSLDVKTDFFQKARFSGGAGEIGIGIDYCIAGRFSVVSNFGVLAALGEQKLSYRVTDPTSKQATLFKNRTHCVLGVDWRGAFQLSGRIWCFYVVGELGYEVNYYHDPIAVVVDSTLQRESQDVGFAGPYFSLALRF